MSDGVRINVNAPAYLKEMLEEMAEEMGVVPEYFIKMPDDDDDEADCVAPA